MPVWPATLPAPMVQGYALQPNDPVIRTQMESGPSRARRRYTQAPTEIPIGFKLTEAQLAIFETFHRNELFDGVAWFDDIPLINGQGVTNYTARFKTMFKAMPLGNQYWHVTATLEVKERPLNA